MIQFLVNRQVRVSVTEMRRKLNIDVFMHPENHLICIPTEQIIADTKVSRKIVELYKRKSQKAKEYYR